jgi:Ion channel
MPNPQEKHESRILKDYVKLLGGFSLFLMIVTLGEAIVASVRYSANAPVIESISHRELFQGWTIVLLWIPLTMQVFILTFLTARVWKQKSNQTIRHYFKFYFVRTFISSFTYVSLWLAYTFVMTSAGDASMVSLLRWVALGCIILLMCFVIQATYLITRTSLRTDRRLFTEKDLDKDYDCICKSLGSVATTRFPPLDKSELRLIHEWLLKDKDYKVHRVAYKGTIADLDLPDLVDALNRLVSSQRFYDIRHDRNDGDEVPPSLFEAKNRDYIEKHLITPCQAKSEPGQAETPKARKSFWEKIIGGDGKSDRQMGQRDGITMFPFYTMVFFFSVFVCIAYLFGFAFAFEDKHVQLSASKPSLGLIMGDDLLEDVGQYSVPTASPAPVTYQLSDRQKFFYFKPGGAGITTAIAPNNSDARLKHIARINERSLSSLVDQIKNALSKGNLRVLLVGRADEKSVDKVAYSSNYDIAKARINSVRYLLQEKLIANHTPRNDLALIEWIESPFSSDVTLLPKRKTEREESKASQILDNETVAAADTDVKVPRELINKMDEDLNLKYGDKAWCGEFRDFLGRLREQARNNAVTLMEMRRIHDDITRWAGLKDGNDPTKAENLGDDIDAELYQIEDPPGRRRAVEVYVYQSHSTSPAPTNTSSFLPRAKRMSLMDYLYFATTTGYGDVKPITPYSKFLCTAAEMTEFFFIVVFFNTLLSLKRRSGRFS